MITFTIRILQFVYANQPCSAAQVAQEFGINENEMFMLLRELANDHFLTISSTAPYTFCSATPQTVEPTKEFLIKPSDAKGGRIMVGLHCGDAYVSAFFNQRILHDVVHQALHCLVEIENCEESH